MSESTNDASFHPLDALKRLNTEPQAAFIEIIEKGHSTDDTPGVIVPNEVRINGIPLLIPAGQQIEVHSLVLNDNERGEDPVCVTLTLFARRVTIAAEGDL
jgi:hypothetical protein